MCNFNFALAEISLKRAVETAAMKYLQHANPLRPVKDCVNIMGPCRGQCTTDGPTCMQREGPFVLDGSEIQSASGVPACLESIRRPTCIYAWRAAAETAGYCQMIGLILSSVSAGVDLAV
jgi:hypothetical protein